MFDTTVHVRPEDLATTFESRMFLLTVFLWTLLAVMSSCILCHKPAMSNFLGFVLHYPHISRPVATSFSRRASSETMSSERVLISTSLLVLSQRRQAKALSTRAPQIATTTISPQVACTVEAKAKKTNIVKLKQRVKSVEERTKGV